MSSVQELQDVMNPIQSMKSLAPGGKNKSAGADAAIPEDNSSTKFFFDGKTFKKTVSKIEKKKNSEIAVEKTKSEDELANNMKQSMEMFYYRI